ncbi:hypothetical protein [Streptomyces europaeiscabiei]|uniref:hypothetical protein n=1 Tax=Streptomyces europaeiscabiei TaxID=146819 RepID=UPI0015C4EBB8|nr:hypothetical protein [Streptomyces europaeiscabiei]MDX3617764.1 hypothetical protein [Streptomyces europaeiscabiei]MDX3636450.1 hypothetical protein [Streptomyces europaeiscabiei]MDX3654455.1 hypothetical protein [Streptomyces europaeiscabiei]
MTNPHETPRATPTGNRADRPRLTRRERLRLAGAALGGLAAGAARAGLTWLLDQLTA